MIVRGEFVSTHQEDNKSKLDEQANCWKDYDSPSRVVLIIKL